MGFTNPEIVSTLSSKHNVSTQSIRRDIRNRTQWQPKLEDSDPKKNMLRAVNRLEWNYRESAFLFKTTNNDNAKLGALSQMRENVKAIAELQGLYATPAVSQGSQLHVVHLHAWRPGDPASDDPLQNRKETVKHEEV